MTDLGSEPEGQLNEGYRQTRQSDTGPIQVKFVQSASRPHGRRSDELRIPRTVDVADCPPQPLPCAFILVMVVSEPVPKGLSSWRGRDSELGVEAYSERPDVDASYPSPA